MGSALLNTTAETELTGALRDCGLAAGRTGVAEARVATAEAPSADALRMQVAERLAAHRRRRGGAAGAESTTTRVAETARPVNTRSARIAAVVAERYAHTPSYRAFLAAEAERAIEQARAAAEVAAMNAQAVAAAQQRLLDAFDEEARQREAAREEAAEAEAGSAPGVTLTPGGAVELDLWPGLHGEQPHEAARSRPTQRDAGRGAASQTPTGKGAGKAAASTVAGPGRGLTVRLYEELGDDFGDDFGEDGVGRAQAYRGITHRLPILAPISRSSPANTNWREDGSEAEAMALDAEIAFRRAPVFEEPAGPPVPLPANLIVFPRHLVASRKARPRLAEGPLRDQSDAAPLDGQLRIFEVDPAQISTEPAGSDAVAPQWTSLWLDTPAHAVEREAGFGAGLEQAGDVEEPAARGVPAIQTAAIGRRVLAGAVDTGIVAAGVGAFAATAAEVFSRAGLWPTDAGSAGHIGGSLVQAMREVAGSIAAQTGLQPGQIGIAAGAAGVFLLVVYHALFFWFSVATPGMRCARIAFCTFDDENPTRRAIRRRLGAMLLSACPLGLGFVCAILDDRRLTWHDRMTRMYLRSY